MTEIKFDRRNYRKHNDRNKALLKKSLEECGAGRSIVTDNSGEIIAGNGIYEQAQALNMPVKVVETDGSELIVVKRTDLSTDDEKRKRLAVMDNSTSDTSEFDLDMLTEDFELDELKEIGFDETNFEIPSIFGELEDGAFADKFKNESEIFSVTFNFPKEKEQEFLAKMKEMGKDEISQAIMNFLGID
ncbi:MAG: hypothetical protein J6C85_02420 [Alphaproteobacteria bacterium]|nr:hypothetical protein [Alphaproteobacteria bacterium]